MQQKFLLGVTFILCTMTLHGCASSITRDRVEQLEQRLRLYGSALRWGDYRHAFDFHAAKEDHEVLADIDMKHVEQFKIIKFQVVSKDIVPFDDKDSGIVEVKIVAEINYVHIDKQVVKKLQAEQTWWYQTKLKKWVVSADFPALK